MAPSKKVVASLVALLVLDNKEKQEKVKKKKKWCKFGYCIDISTPT
jgi:hypothetical protein